MVDKPVGNTNIQEVLEEWENLQIHKDSTSWYTVSQQALHEL